VSAGEPPRDAGVRAPDGDVLAPVAFLICCGVVMSYSTAAPLAEAGGLPPSFARHLGGVAAGLVIGALAMRVPLAVWHRLALPLWAVSVLLLVATWAIAPVVNGARRWLPIPGLGSFQPAEIAKLATLLVVAAWLSRRNRTEIRRATDLVGPGLFAAIPAGLLLLQPDFGSAALILGLTGLLLFATGTPLRYFALPSLLCSAGAAAYVYSHPYALARWTGFLRPYELARDKGFQLVQSFVAFGRGGVTGVGLGDGRQKLYYLPEANTDFILSVLAEEVGLVGVLAVLGAFAALAIGGIRIARRARSRFALLVGFGMTALLVFPAALNAGVVMGLLPTKGLALPFLSYGRTATLVACAAVGILLGLGRREAAPEPVHVRGAERRGLVRGAA
jgi:cell division protein FtsW